jgi:hypothetical protein
MHREPIYKATCIAALSLEPTLLLPPAPFACVVASQPQLNYHPLAAKVSGENSVQVSEDVSRSAEFRLRHHWQTHGVVEKLEQVDIDVIGHEAIEAQSYFPADYNTTWRINYVATNIEADCARLILRTEVTPKICSNRVVFARYEENSNTLQAKVSVSNHQVTEPVSSSFRNTPPSLHIVLLEPNLPRTFPQCTITPQITSPTSAQLD